METKSKVIVGIDWSRDQHQVNVFNEAGQTKVDYLHDNPRQIGCRIRQERVMWF